MPLNVTYPTSVNVGFFISLGWSNTFNDDYFTVSRQINSRLTWQGTIFPIGSNLTRYSEMAEETWSNVRYRVSGFPSGAVVETDWINVIGGSDPGDPGDPGDPPPTLGNPIMLVPHTVAPNTNFTVSWSDTNVGATYDLDEEVNNGDWQSIATNITTKSRSRFALTSWNTVRYRVRAKLGTATTPWSYSPQISVAILFSPRMSVKIGTSARTVKDGWVKVDGQLRKITDIWTMVNGELKKS